MIKGHSHINYSLEDIEKYLEGKMSATEMHELEKAALQNPFLSDAIEGYKETSMQTAHRHLQEIKQELLNDKDEAKIVSFPSSASIKWWRMAAVVIIIATVGTVTWKLIHQNNKQEGLAENKKDVVIKKDSATPPLTTNSTRKNKAAIDKALSSPEKAAAVIYNHPDASEKAIAANRKSNKTTGATDKNNAEVLTNEQDNVASVPYYTRKDSVIPTFSPADKEIARNAPVLNEKPIPDPYAKNQAEMALQGKVAGVYVSKNKIKQGSGKIAIRGSATVSSKSPLYVIDGIVYDSIPPEIPSSKIKSLNILKDANATAIYGAKAANGVIVITTKLKNKTLQGRIVNQNGVGIAGASITINHNKQRLLTDSLGNFTVKSLDGSAIASVNSVGYQPLQSVLKANQQNRIVLQENQNYLNDVVVIGYSAKRKVTVTGSVSKVTSSKNVTLNADTPIPDGGWDNYKVYLSNQLTNGTNSPVHGNIELEFTMNKARKATHINILQSPDKNKNSHITKAVKKGPKWAVQGKNKNKRYKVIITL